MDKFEIIGKKLEHKGKIVDFYSMNVKVPNGNTAEWDLIEHKGAAAVVPVDDEGKILMVRQSRGAIDDIMLEIPAGALEESGIFLLKGSVKDVAAGLRCSQASVYRYLAQIKR